MGRRKRKKKERNTAGARTYGNRGELDEITGTSAWRQPDPRDGIKFSFGARSRVTNYRYRGLPPPARQIDFRWTFGFSPVARGSSLRDARRCPSADDGKPNNGRLKYTLLEVHSRSWKLKDRRAPRYSEVQFAHVDVR